MDVNFSNSYVVCFETEYRQELETTNDECLKIINTQKFIKILTDTLHKEVNGIGFVACAKCIYADSIDDIDKKFVEFVIQNPWVTAFIKPKKFSHEKEFRVFAGHGNTHPAIKIKTGVWSYLYKHAGKEYNFPEQSSGDTVDMVNKILIKNKNLVNYVER